MTVTVIEVGNIGGAVVDQFFQDLASPGHFFHPKDFQDLPAIILDIAAGFCADAFLTDEFAGTYCIVLTRFA